MNGKKVCAIGWFVLSSLWVGSVGADTFSYDAVVTSASGVHAAVLLTGEAVTISYTLDSLAADSNSDPQRGIFANAVLSLSVSFPNLGVFAVAGPTGLAQTFDNIVDEPSGTSSDQVFFFGGPLSSASLLGGEQISSLEVDFLSAFAALPAEPLMLSNDGLPLFKLPTTDAFLILSTSSGSTFVQFESQTGPAQTPATLSLVSGDGQTGTAGQALANPFVVQVTDDTGNTAAGVPVNFTVTAGGGELVLGETLSDAEGLAFN